VVAELGTDLESWNCDLSADGSIDFDDFSMFAARWKELLLGGPDIDGSGEVDIYDLAVFADNWLSCFHIPAEATYPNPADNAINMGPHIILKWSPSKDTLSHDVYFGTDEAEVTAADTADANVYMGNQDTAEWDTNNYDANGLEYSRSYFWRIDEITPCGIEKGQTWSFTTMDEPDIEPVGWWRFDEGQGSTAGDSSGGNNGTLIGNTSWVAGRIGPYALEFDGDGDYVEIPDDDSLDIAGQMTICAWIKCDMSGFRTILAKQPGDFLYDFYPGNYMFYIYNGRLRLSHEAIIPDYVRYESSSSVVLGLWQYVAVTIIQNGDVNFYIDGLGAGTVPQEGTFGVFNNEPVRIGIRKGGRYDFDGAIDEVRIYNKALSAEEIEQLYQEGL
jgi:hypothetical protein